MAICQTCGFDYSCDYEHFVTLAPCGSVKSISARHTEWEQKNAEQMSDVVICLHCGGMQFQVSKKKREIRCVRCHNAVSLKEIFPEEQAFTPKQAIREQEQHTIAAGGDAELEQQGGLNHVALPSM